jgi:hypothetical protein
MCFYNISYVGAVTATHGHHARQPVLFAKIKYHLVAQAAALPAQAKFTIPVGSQYIHTAQVKNKIRF